jgi:STE24 endopeptidase
VNGYALAGTALAAVLVSLVALWLLSPEQGPPDPDPGTASRVISERFSEAELERADRYRSLGRAIGMGSLAAQFALLLFLAFWRGRPMRRLISFLGRRPLPGAVAFGASISVALALVGLPFDLASWRLGSDYGLIGQGLTGRLSDWAISTVIGLVLAGGGALAAMALWRRLGGRFWLAGATLVGAWAVVSTWLWPVLVSPLFNDFEPLRDGPARREVMRLADRAGVDVGEVYVVDASRRSSLVNAYVNGIGSSKRVVIYDNAIRGLTPAEFSALVGHELGHVEGADLRRGLGFALLVIPLGVLFVQLATIAAVRRTGDDPRGPAVVPALALTATLAVFVLQIPGNALSRQVEAKADRTSIELTDRPRGLVDLQVKLAKSNLSDVDPPVAWHFLFGTHPSTLDRIAIAEGAEEDR